MDEEQQRARRGDGPRDSDTERVADLRKSYHPGHMDLVVADLEWLLERPGRASKARRVVARIPRRQLRAGLAVRSRSGSRA